MQRTEGFTVVACGLDTCPDRGVDPLTALRHAVRQCKHGVLVRNGCPLALLPRTGHSPTYKGSPPGAGPFVFVQPCDAARRATFGAVLAGPLHEPADVTDLCHWLTDGLLVGEPLPDHLLPSIVANDEDSR